MNHLAQSDMTLVHGYVDDLMLEEELAFELKKEYIFLKFNR